MRELVEIVKIGTEHKMIYVSILAEHEDSPSWDGWMESYNSTDRVVIFIPGQQQMQ